MKRYEHLDHTAEIKVRSYGRTLEQAFSNMVPGAYSFLIDPDQIKPVNNKKIHVESSSLQALLYDFLSELIVLTDTTGLIFCQAQDLKIKKGRIYSLDCTVLGDKASNYPTKGDLKAVTYSEMSIVEGEKSCSVTVVFDI